MAYGTAATEAEYKWQFEGTKNISDFTYIGELRGVCCLGWEKIDQVINASHCYSLQDVDEDEEEHFTDVKDEDEEEMVNGDSVPASPPAGTTSSTGTSWLHRSNTKGTYIGNLEDLGIFENACIKMSLQYRALSYYNDLTLTQSFHPVVAQLKRKLRSHWLKFLQQRYVTVVR